METPNSLPPEFFLATPLTTCKNARVFGESNSKSHQAENITVLF